MQFLLAAAALFATGHALQNQYIVELNVDESQRSPASAKMDLQWVKDILQKNHRDDANNNKIVGEFNMGSSLQAFAIKTSPETFDEIKSDSRVASAIKDRKKVLYQWPFGGSAWGIDRSDQRSLPLDKKYNASFTNQGEGVTVYVIDTGINAEHEDFEGRASEGPSFVDAVPGTDSKDLLGHGTHCAGTIASKSYGIAKKAKVVGISIFGNKNYASTASVIAALNWVYNNGQSGKSVVSMSLGDDLSSCTVAEPCNDPISKKAVAALAVDRNIPVVVAAGNDNTDACKGAPASEPMAYTVGSTTTSDSRSSFSNYGSCVDIFAPGSNIKSTWIGGTTSSRTISGTSMACPHVSGAFALLLADQEFATVQDAYDEMSRRATAEVVNDARSVNKLLYVGPVN